MKLSIAKSYAEPASHTVDGCANLKGWGLATLACSEAAASGSLSSISLSHIPSCDYHCLNILLQVLHHSDKAE